MDSPNVSKTGTGRSSVIAVDPMTNPFNLGISAEITSGSATFNIEYSMDDPADPGYVASSATWYIASGFSAATASTGGALTVPCRALSINVTAGTGAVKLTVLQAGLR